MEFGADSKKQNITNSKEEEEEVGIVEFEGEIMRALDKLKKARINNKEPKEHI